MKVSTLVQSKNTVFSGNFTIHVLDILLSLGQWGLCSRLATYGSSSVLMSLIGSDSVRFVKRASTSEIRTGRAKWGIYISDPSISLSLDTLDPLPKDEDGIKYVILRMDNSFQ
jgi:hypothetical protein